ncbi:DUF5312 family protein [Thermospira aquatica]|uniref:Exocyst complex component Sec6 n=1 Tax=Thermospira aquatica TaxID=2828656 RepID=A0AAX3BCQ9_9SPIR|nr:DUF5312 family protein [Thermospira aquatica]URA09804.1 hypothetical protein KDW03_10000 [Thermospira aquatica]
MPYDKENIERAKAKGLFQNGVFDAKALELDSEEKERLKKELTKIQSNSTEQAKPQQAPVSPAPLQEEIPINIQLSLWDKIVMFFLALLGMQVQENYLQYKALRQVYKDLALIRPPIYNKKQRTVTRYFAYKIHDLQLKLLFFKPMFEIMETPQWDTAEQGKTGIERLCEALMQVDKEKVFAIFGYESIYRRLQENPSSQTIAAIRQEAEEYLASLSSEKKETANRAYTFLMYMKNLVFYEFEWLLKRFDPSYEVGKEAHFIDIPGEALLFYLTNLEEALLQIDLNIDFLVPFQALFSVYDEMTSIDEANEKSEKEMIKTTFLSQIDALKSTLQELLYRNYCTLLIRVIKKNPSYFPSFVHIRFDLVQKYTEIMEKKLKWSFEKAMRQVKFEKVEKNIRAYFPNLKPVGIYTMDRSKELENLGFPTFSHAYTLAILIHFFDIYYKEWIQPLLNIVTINGIFNDEYFKRSVSDTLYAVERFQTKLQEIVNSFHQEGDRGSKFLLLFKRRETQENKRSLEKHIISMNSIVADLFREFYGHYLSLKDIVTKLYSDTTEPIPKYLRNARSVGQSKNQLYKESLKKTWELFQSLEPILQMLRETPF